MIRSARVACLVASSLSLAACQIGGRPAVRGHTVLSSAAPRSVDVSDIFGSRAEAWPVQTATEAEGLDESALLDLEETGDDEVVSATVAVASLWSVRTGTVSYGIPLSDDERVAQWVGYLTGRGRRWFSKWLARSTRYVPFLWEALDRHAVPRDAVFLSMVESGFSPRAYSWAHAAGIWQFMPRTGRGYGLKVGFWVDERLDFLKASDAAARYLSRLYNTFEDWHLAFAAYNAGPGKVRRAIRNVGSKDYWKLSRTWYLRRETQHYVPKILAAMIVSKSPEQHGFDALEYLPPLAWDTLTVTDSTDLKTIARACGTSSATEELGRLNPELRIGVTPPGKKYDVRVLPETAATCRAGLAAMQERLTYRYHVVSAADTLSSIAARHHTDPASVLAFHGVDEEELLMFGEVAVPVPLSRAGDVKIVEPDPHRFRGGSYKPDGQRLVQHVVRPGDSLWKIARKYRVGLKKLRLWNGLWQSNHLKLGRRLKVYLGRGGAPSKGLKRRASKAQPIRKRPISHRVRAGESLWTIARKYGTSVSTLRKANGLAVTAVLQIGQRLRIK